MERLSYHENLRGFKTGVSMLGRGYPRIDSGGERKLVISKFTSNLEAPIQQHFSRCNVKPLISVLDKNTFCI